jgi:hypothetical protein
MTVRWHRWPALGGPGGRVALGLARQPWLKATAVGLVAMALLAAALCAEEPRPSSEAKPPAPDVTGPPSPTPAPAAPTPAPAPAPPRSEAARKVIYPKKRAEMEPLAKADPLAFMRLALNWHDANVTDYSCQFVKIEKIGGELRKPETMQMKFRVKPFSVYLKWTAEASKGQEVIYVDGVNDDKAYVHPSGILGILFRKVNIDPLSKTARKHSRRPITMAGTGNMLRLIISQCEAAKANGDLTLTYEGVQQEAGRPAYVFKRVLPHKWDYTCPTLLIYIDCENLLCVRTDAWDWDGELLSHYSYSDLMLNPGLGDEDFSPDNANYSFRLF